jgi:tetratricopeptide (TPR) repeat protein
MVGGLSLFAAASAPGIALQLAVARHRRATVPSAPLAPALAGVGYGLLLLSFVGLVRHSTLFALPGFGALLLLGTAGRVLRDRSRVARAVRAGHLQAALLIPLSRWSARDPIVRHDRAIARALRGDAAGIAELETLIEERPSFSRARLTAAAQLDGTDAERALRHAVAFRAAHPDLADGHAAEARALLTLDRPADAEAPAARADALDSKSGAAYSAIAAARRGERELALQRLERALDVDPGSPSTRLAEAEVALASGDTDGARRALDAAKSMVDITPTSTFRPAIERLAARIDPCIPAGD